MPRGRRSRSSSPPRGRRSRGYSTESSSSSSSSSGSSTSDYSSSDSSSYSRSPSRSRRRARRSSRSRSRSRRRTYTRSSRNRSPRGSRRRSRSRNRERGRSTRSDHRRSRRYSRDRRRSRSRSRNRRRSRSRSRDRHHSSRGQHRRRSSRERDSKSRGSDEKKSRESAAQKMKEQVKTLLKKAEASDDVLREQFEERYYGDSEKVRWERFKMDSSAPLNEEEESSAPVLQHTAVPPSAELSEARRQVAIEEIDSDKFTQKAFISRRLPIASAAKTIAVSESLSADQSHEAAMFGMSSSSVLEGIAQADSKVSSASPVRIDSSANDPLMSSLLDEEKSVREARWREKLHQLRQAYAQRREQTQQC